VLRRSSIGFGAVAAILVASIVTGTFATSAAGVSAPAARVNGVREGKPGWLSKGPGITRFGSFSGYVWYGDERSVAATWTVPRILKGSRMGFAGTWIGAQGAGTRNKAPFIQIGTIEQSLGLKLPGFAGSFYMAFFSDTKLGFHAHVLFGVHPGDTVTARMYLANGRWHLLIVDRTRHRRRAIVTTDEGGASFNAAEWLEEDPSEPHRRLPYAVLSTVGFSRLRVDAHDPGYGRIYSSWMSEHATDLAPGPLVDDAFTLAQTRPSATGTHYLRITVALDLALERFERDLQLWSPESSRAAIATQRVRVTTAMRADIREVSATQWPGRAEVLSQALIAATRVEIAQVRRAPSLTAAGISLWRRRWDHAYSRVRAISWRIRRVLDLPQLFALPAK
jgi:hypothetical protein